MWALVNSKSTSWNLVERLCFPAPKASYNIKSFPEELIVIPRRDGAKVPCLFLPFKHARFLILYFHGNAEDLGLCHQFCSSMREQFQVHLLAVEYPGYGICPGPCDEEGIVANARAAMTFALDSLQWPSDGIKILGRSLGTGPAVRLASEYDLAGLILVTPFLSIREVFRGQVGGLADLMNERFKNIDLVELVHSPTLIIHGQQDSLIPCEQGEMLYSKLSCKKMMVCPAEMGHNTSLLSNIGTFVLPMIQFFSLPDYTFEDVDIPAWAFPDLSKSEEELLTRSEEDALMMHLGTYTGTTLSAERSALAMSSVPSLPITGTSPAPPHGLSPSTSARARQLLELEDRGLNQDGQRLTASRSYSFSPRNGRQGAPVPNTVPNRIAPRPARAEPLQDEDESRGLAVVNDLATPRKQPPKNAGDSSNRGEWSVRAGEASGAAKAGEASAERPLRGLAQSSSEASLCREDILKAVDESVNLFVDSGMSITIFSHVPTPRPTNVGRAPSHS